MNLENIRHKHKQLLIRVTDKLWIGIHTLLVCLLHNLSASIMLTFIEGSDVGEVDLFPHQGLESWLSLVAVVMAVVVAVTMISVAVIMA